MRTLNLCILIGRVGRDPETKNINGNAYASFSMATSFTWKVGDEWKEKADWHQVAAWRQTAEVAAKFKKGDLVQVQGRIEYREYEGKWYTTIIADRVQLFDRPKADRQAAPPEAADWMNAPAVGTSSNGNNGWGSATTANTGTVSPQGVVDDLPF